ncbi:MAG: hypothetical protein OEM82_03310, partial [Acidobacteriota bacterium]|nr:hypothetical protein [Acidobacteriota bacterium]
MIRLFLNTVLTGGFLLALSVSATGQAKPNGTARKLLNGTAKTTVVVVGQSAKYGWKATRFTAGKVVRPIVVKSAPKAGKFTLRQTTLLIKGSIPVVKKFAVTYLKFRFSP